MRRARSERSPPTSSADSLPSIARFSSDSITGSSDCASSRVKVFMEMPSFIGYDETGNREQGLGNRFRTPFFALFLNGVGNFYQLKIVLSHPCDRKKSHGWGTALLCGRKMPDELDLFPIPYSLRFQHAVEGDFGPAFHVWPHLDAVDYAAFDQVLQGPGQMLRCDAEHGGAQATGVVEGDDALALFGKTAGHAVDQVNLSADSKHLACRSLLDQSDESLGGTESI